MKRYEAYYINHKEDKQVIGESDSLESICEMIRGYNLYWDCVILDRVTGDEGNLCKDYDYNYQVSS